MTTNERSVDVHDKSGDRSERSGDRSDRSGDRSERSGDRSERSGDRSERSGDKSERSGVVHDRSGDRSDKSGDRSERSGDRSERSGVVHDRSGDRSERSGDRSDRSGDRSDLSGAVHDKSGDRSEKSGKSRIRVLDDETYNKILQFLTDESFVEPQDKKKIKRLSINYHLEDDLTKEEWPRGKILYKVKHDKSRKVVVGRKLVVPPNKVEHVIKSFHEKTAKHQGWSRTFKLINANHIGVTEQAVRKFVNNCETCIKFTGILKKPRLNPILSTGINERFQVDMKEYELYEADNDGYRYHLTVIDHFSGYPWAFPTFTKTKEEVSSILIKLFFDVGPPKILHSDNGGEFINGIIDEISKSMNITLAHGKAYNPREQGKVEKFNGTLANLLSKMMYAKNTNRWIDLVDECLFAYRITKGPTSKTPYELYYLREPNFVLNLPEVNERNKHIENDEVELDFKKISKMSQEIMAVTRAEREANAEKMKKRWDTNNTQKAKVGDFILTEKLLYDQPTKHKLRKKRKLGDALFVKPGVVVKVHANGNVSVKWKETETVDVVANNKFKVVSKHIFDCTVAFHEGDEDTFSSSTDEETMTKLKKNNTKTSNIASSQNKLDTVETKTGSKRKFSAIESSNDSSISVSSNSESSGSSDSFILHSQPENEEKTLKQTKFKHKFVLNEEPKIKNWRPLPGLHVLIHWKEEDAWYPGTVAKWSETENKWFINYKDGDKQYHKFNSKKWKIDVGNNPRILKSIHVCDDETQFINIGM
jgi:transposase InsO family protein